MGDAAFDDWLEITPHDEPQTQASITKGHWLAPASRAACAACAKKFDLTLKREWCRRCGDIFCRRCRGFARRLDVAANLDPLNGAFYPVCGGCFRENSPQTLGPTRSHTSVFCRARDGFRAATQNTGLTAAAKRLATAFGAASALARTVTSLVVPDWAKVNWMPESAAQKFSGCPTCEVKFGLLTRRHFCRLCGLVFCQKCLFHSLLVYMESPTVAKVCPAQPDLHPPGHVVVPACSPCLDELKGALALRRSKFERQRSQGEALWTEGGRALVEANAAYAALQPRIATALAAYQELIAALGTATSNGRLPAGRGAVPTLAKHQTDLGDLFAQYTTLLQSFKAIFLIDSGAAHRELTKRVLASKTAFYRNNFWAFRSLKTDLQESLPEEAVALIQLEMDIQAMNYACCLFQQITIESLAWPELQRVSVALMELTEVARATLQELVTSKSDGSWPAFEAEAKIFVTELGKTSPILTTIYGLSDWQGRMMHLLQDLFAAITLQLVNRGTIKVTKPTLDRMEQTMKDVVAKELRTAETFRAIGNDHAPEDRHHWVLL